MYGTATLEIPQAGDIRPSRTEGLSDRMAMVMGRIAALTLSEQDSFVIVTLADGTARTIGHDTVKGELTFGRLGRPIVIRPIPDFGK
jgi:hypothetical protein